MVQCRGWIVAAIILAIIVIIALIIWLVSWIQRRNAVTLAAAGLEGAFNNNAAGITTGPTILPVNNGAPVITPVNSGGTVPPVITGGRRRMNGVQMGSSNRPLTYREILGKRA